MDAGLYNMHALAAMHRESLLKENFNVKQTNRLAGVMIPLMMALLVGCKAAPAANVGFADPTLLKHDPTIPFDKFWRDPSVDWKTYDKIYVAPVNTDYMLKTTAWQQGQPKAQIEADSRKLSDHAHDSIVKAFRDDPNHRFAVVDVAGHDPHTLVFEVALIEVVPSKVLLNALGFAPFWVGTGITVVRSVANDKSTAAFEARVSDAATGKYVIYAADREAEQFAPLDVRGLTWYSDAEGIMDEWAKQFVEIADRKPGQKIEVAPTFRLLPW
jgi:hypothetical protein